MFMLDVYFLSVGYTFMVSPKGESEIQHYLCVLLSYGEVR